MNELKAILYEVKPSAEALSKNLLRDLLAMLAKAATE
jgi:hypothetical protein